MRNYHFLLVGLVGGIVIGSTSKTVQRHYQCICHRSKDEMTKAYQQLNRAGTYLNEVGSCKMKKDFDNQLTKLKRLYHDLTNTEAKDEIKSKVKEFLKDVDDLLVKIKDTLKTEDFDNGY